MDLLVPSILLSLVYILIKLYFKKKPKSQFELLPTVGRQFMCGNLLHFARMKSKIQEVPDLTYILQTLNGFAYMLYKEGMCFSRFGTKKVLLLFGPESVEALLSSQVEIDKAGAYKPVEHLLGNGLITCRADRWRKNRKLLNPSFNIKILESFLPIMNNHSRTLIDKMLLFLDKESVDITKLSILCSFDILLETAIGTKLNAQKNDSSQPLLLAFQTVFEIWVERTFSFLLKFDSLFERLPIGKIFYKNSDYLFSYTKEVNSGFFVLRDS